MLLRGKYNDNVERKFLDIRYSDYTYYNDKHNVLFHFLGLVFSVKYVQRRTACVN